MELKGTKTEKNLWTAFAGESQARNKYTYFASVAKKEGYEQIAEIFTKTAENEKEHAKMWFKALGELGDTAQNLLHAAEAEQQAIVITVRASQLWSLCDLRLLALRLSLMLRHDPRWQIVERHHPAEGEKR